MHTYCTLYILVHTCILYIHYHIIYIVTDERCLALSGRLYNIVHKSYAPFFGALKTEDLYLTRSRPKTWVGLT